MKLLLKKPSFGLIQAGITLKWLKWNYLTLPCIVNTKPDWSDTYAGAVLHRMLLKHDSVKISDIDIFFIHYRLTETTFGEMYVDHADHVRYWFTEAERNKVCDCFIKTNFHLRIFGLIAFIKRTEDNTILYFLHLKFCLMKTMVLLYSCSLLFCLIKATGQIWKKKVPWYLC